MEENVTQCSYNAIICINIDAIMVDTRASNSSLSAKEWKREQEVEEV